MRFGMRSLAVVLVLICSFSMLAQEFKYLSETFPLLGRFSYTSTWYLRTPDDARRVCMAVFENGRYRMLRSTGKGTSTVQGTLSATSLLELRKMLEDPSFRGLESDDASLVRAGSESFMAEIPGQSETQRLTWTNPDEERPFPAPVRNLVSWLQRYKVENPELLDVDDSDICPAGQVRPLRPGVAENRAP